MESDTHKALKQAVMRQHGDEYVRGEKRVYIDYSRYFIVDLYVESNHRRIFYECETSPSIPRLRDKGRRRNLYDLHNNYLLVVPSEEYSRHDWKRLRGYFDKVIAYSLEEQRFTEEKDLRLLPGLQELVEESRLINKYEVMKRRLVKNRNNLMVLYRKLRLCLRARQKCAFCHLMNLDCSGENCYWYKWRDYGLEFLFCHYYKGY